MLKLTNEEYVDLTAKEFIFTHKKCSCLATFVVFSLAKVTISCNLRRTIQMQKRGKPQFFSVSGDICQFPKGEIAIGEFLIPASCAMVLDDNIV